MQYEGFNRPIGWYAKCRFIMHRLQKSPVETVYSLIAAAPKKDEKGKKGGKGLTGWAPDLGLREFVSKGAPGGLCGVTLGASRAELFVKRGALGLACGQVGLGLGQTRSDAILLAKVLDTPAPAAARDTRTERTPRVNTCTMVARSSSFNTGQQERGSERETQGKAHANVWMRSVLLHPVQHRTRQLE